MPSILNDQLRTKAKGLRLMENKKKKFLLKRNIYLAWEMPDSEAFKTLSAKAIQALLRFLQKRTWSGKKSKRIFHNSGLAFTYTEAAELGISTSQFHTIIKKLFEVGFIEIEHQGGGLAKDYSRYALSERWRDYGTPKFKKLEKKKTLWPGNDVHSRKMKKLEKVTENRSCQLRELVTIEGIDEIQGIGNP